MEVPKKYFLAPFPPRRCASAFLLASEQTERPNAFTASRDATQPRHLILRQSHGVWSQEDNVKALHTFSKK